MKALHPSITWAREILAHPHILIGDTETTGLDPDAEVIEIALIDLQGNVMLNTRIQCQAETIEPRVTVINGITKEMLAIAPNFPSVYATLLWLFTSASYELIFYNAAYDLRILNQTLSRYNLVLPALPTHCLMLQYSAYIGEPASYPHEDEYRYQRLSHARNFFGLKQPQLHNALTDSQMALEVLKKLAALES